MNGSALMNSNTYALQKKESFSDRLTTSTRMRMYRLIERALPLLQFETILDVGVTTDREMLASNFFEKSYPHPERVTTFSDQNASWLEKEYPGMKFVLGDALSMPFEDNSFDFVFSSAVIEHVGSRLNQERFINELFRVAKEYVCITTPNRWFPIESHTVLPLLHWLPSKLHRRILKILKKDFFSQEENLNLLDRKSIEEMIKKRGISDYRLQRIRVLAFTSNLILIIQKHMVK